MLTEQLDKELCAISTHLNHLASKARIAANNQCYVNEFRQSLLDALPVMLRAVTDAEPHAREYLTTEEARQFLNLGKGTLDAYRKRGTGGPPVYRAGSKCLYKRSELVRWLESSGRTPKENA